MDTNLELKQELAKLNHTLARLNRNQTLSRSFFSGIVYGLGSVIGATLVVALLIYLLQRVEVVPLVGDWIAKVVEEVMVKTAPLAK